MRLKLSGSSTPAGRMMSKYCLPPWLNSMASGEASNAEASQRGWVLSVGARRARAPRTEPPSVIVAHKADGRPLPAALSVMNNCVLLPLSATSRARPASSSAGTSAQASGKAAASLAAGRLSFGSGMEG